MDNKELIIKVSPNETSIVLTESKQLVEIYKEKSNKKFSVGDIYVAKVKKIMNGLNSAFVDVGYKRDAFLHYFDLGPQFNSLQKFLKQVVSTGTVPKLQNFKLEDDIDKRGKMSNVLSGGQVILVQIAKEPISTKGPRLNSEISLAGRNLVLIPFSNKVSISQKIKVKEERDRLKKLILSIKPNNYGVIVRTVAKNRRVAVLDEELRELVEKWEKAFEDIKVANPPVMLMGELNRPNAVLRDILSSDFSGVYVDEEETYKKVKEYVNQIAPERTKLAKLYSGKEDIFEHFGIIKQIKALFGKTVNIKSGAYLIIEHTEALHVIDVNSGNRSKKSNNQETNAVEVNTLAAKEVARQLRLRDMGGIIVIDFIDMYTSDNRRLVYEVMREEMEKDRTKHTILPLTKFGLMQITRQRVRPATNIETKETCPVCDGTGEITPSILFIDEIENHLRYILENHKESITLVVHPYIAGYVKQGMFSRRFMWFKKYKRWVKIKPAITYSFLEYSFYNSKGVEIKE